MTADPIDSITRCIHLMSCYTQIQFELVLTGYLTSPLTRGTSPYLTSPQHSNQSLPNFLKNQKKKKVIVNLIENIIFKKKILTFCSLKNTENETNNEKVTMTRISINYVGLHMLSVHIK